MQIVDIILQIVIVLCGITGLVLHSGILHHEFRANMFLYYTNLSNLWVTVYYLLRLIVMLFTQKGILFSDGIQFSMTMSIFITFVIFHFIIRPGFKKDENFDYDKFNDLSNKFVHYIVPILCVVRWIFFAYKEDLTMLNAVLWTIIPCIYVTFSMLNAHNSPKFEFEDARYPYEFLNVDKLGKQRVAINIAAIWLAFVALGLIVIAFC